MTTQKQELMPCPFCGGKAEITNKFFGQRLTEHGELADYFYVFCHSCQACTIERTVKSAAMEAWNTRVSTDLYDAVVAERDALRKLCDEIIKDQKLALSWMRDAQIHTKHSKEAVSNVTAHLGEVEKFLGQALTAYEKYKAGE